MEETKRCPYCDEIIQPRAKKCKHCGEWLEKPEDLKNKFPKPERTGGETVRLEQPLYGAVNPENLPEGHVIDDRYEIKEKLGQGGFGAVYLAWDCKLEKDKALKVIPDAVSSDKRAMQNLKKEAQTMMDLNHPGIVRFYDFHDEGMIKYIDMEYVKGKTLNELLLEYPDQKMPEARVKELAICICEAMQYAHDKNVIHRDIKPQNIMLTETGEIKIMDFGVAETLRNSVSRIVPGGTTGTLVYMSPEQVWGEAVGRESDIYSFGAMLYEFLSGNPPFYRGDIAEQIKNKQPAAIPGISGEMNEMVMKCLEKNIEQRFSNFKDILSLLTKVYADFPSEDGEKLSETVENDNEKEENNFAKNEFSFDDIDKIPYKPNNKRKVVIRISTDLFIIIIAVLIGILFRYLDAVNLDQSISPVVYILFLTIMGKLFVSSERKFIFYRIIPFSLANFLILYSAVGFKINNEFLREYPIAFFGLLISVVISLIIRFIYFVKDKISKKKKNKLFWRLLIAVIVIGGGLFIVIQNYNKYDRREAEKRKEEAKKHKYPGMVYVKGGWFEMGSNSGESDEKPVHRVWVDDFYIGMYEVTFSEYDKFCETTGRSKPSDYGWGRGNRPVINISWHDAKAYCEWVGGRLPTEAEWEYAAKGGEKSRGYKYSGSDDIGSVAWYTGNSGRKTHPVGRKNPNELGIYDMTGNVWEWCSDWYGRYYYLKSPKRNPKGALHGTARIRRGGCWGDKPQSCLLTYRPDRYPAAINVDQGFRLVRMP